jgi:hypothetical protein
LENFGQTNNNNTALKFRDGEASFAVIETIFADHTINAQNGILAFTTINAGTKTEKMRIMNTGNIGIGTTNPTAQLMVNGSAATVLIKDPSAWSASLTVSDVNDYYRWGMGSGTMPGTAGGVAFDTQSEENLIRMSTGTGDTGKWNSFINYNNAGSGTRFTNSDLSTTFLAIKPSGNVGIGNSNVSAPLQVSKDATLNSGTEAQLQITGSTNLNYKLEIGMDTNTSFGFIQPTQIGSGYKNLSLNPLGGNVGIGTSVPGTKLEVNGNITQTCTGGDANARWTAGNNHCYMRFNTTKTWEDARVDCESRGGYLATITYASEQTIVWSNVGATNAWIGLNDIVTEGTWQSVTGSYWPYMHWDTGEPNNTGGNEDCVQFTATGAWNDATCTNTYGYICERDL